LPSIFQSQSVKQGLSHCLPIGWPRSVEICYPRALYLCSTLYFSGLAVPHGLLDPEYEGIKILQSTGNYACNYTASHCTRLAIYPSCTFSTQFKDTVHVTQIHFHIRYAHRDIKTQPCIAANLWQVWVQDIFLKSHQTFLETSGLSAETYMELKIQVFQVVALFPSGLRALQSL